MPNYDRNSLTLAASKQGFVRDTFEKVLRLTDILKFINEDDFLSQHLVLKGGTAINLTIFSLPRLSVDIDLDYVPNCPRHEMEAGRKAVAEILEEHMTSEGYSLSQTSRFSHSLDGFHFRYRNAGGNLDTLKVEINYSLRSHVLPEERRQITTDAFGEPGFVRTLAPLEIFASKANALLNRSAARDLYDFDNAIESGVLSGHEEMLRKCIIFYNTISSDDSNVGFNASAIESITMGKVRRDLIPLLHDKSRFDLEGRKKRVADFLSAILVLQEDEKQYVQCFKNHEYRPELLFQDADILERIRNHPMALWKCSAHAQAKRDAT